MRERPQLTRQIALVSLAAAGVGVGVGLLSAAFRIATDALRSWMQALSTPSASSSSLSWVLPVCAAAILAIAALWLVRRFAPEAGGSGVQEIEGALDENRPVRWKRVIPVKFAGAWMALGSGMALGREGPTVQMGGNFGAMVSESLGLTRDARHVLIAAGAAAGLSAAFNAPLSGVLFVIEEMRPQFRYGFLSFQSVLIAAVCADVVTRMGIGQAPILITADLSAPALSTLPLFLVYGGLLGVAAVMFTRTLIAVQDLFARLSPTGRLMAAGVIGATIGFAGWIDPGIVGGGYSTIHEALTVENTVGALLVLCLVRYALTLFSYGSGVPGGIFAPMLALGTLLGMAFGHGVDEIVPGLVSHPGIFAVAGMAAFFSATVRAPITGIVLTLEMTGDFGLILALLVTCLAATFVAEGLGARPIYEVLLEKTIERESGSG